MSAAEDRRRAGLLVRLREVRMEVAARALAEARAATAAAEAARLAADEATATADLAHRDARERLGGDLGEAERLLAMLDQARFRKAVADQALEEARQAEAERQAAEARQRREATVARARHAGVEARAATLARRHARRREASEQADFDDRRLRT